MARRVVHGARDNGETGLFVSPPGVDAYLSGNDGLLLFSSSLRHVMMVQTGSFDLNSGNGYHATVAFDNPPPFPPIVLALGQWQITAALQARPQAVKISVNSNQSFDAWSQQDPQNNNYLAQGNIPYVAFLLQP